jgi:hypothetical protein
MIELFVNSLPSPPRYLRRYLSQFAQYVVPKIGGIEKQRTPELQESHVWMMFLAQTQACTTGHKWATLESSSLDAKKMDSKARPSAATKRPCLKKGCTGAGRSADRLHTNNKDRNNGHTTGGGSGSLLAICAAERKPLALY